MFNGKRNSTNSANSNNTRITEMVKPTANGTKLSEMIQKSVLLLLCGLSQVFEIFICKFLYIKIISLINKK